MKGAPDLGMKAHLPTTYNNKGTTIGKVFANHLTNLLQKTDWEKVQSILDLKVIDINYNNGAIIKRLLQIIKQLLQRNRSINKIDKIDKINESVLERLVDRHNLDIHTGEECLLEHMVTNAKLKEIKYIIKTGREIFYHDKNSVLKKYHEQAQKKQIILPTMKKRKKHFKT